MTLQKIIENHFVGKRILKVKFTKGNRQLEIIINKNIVSVELLHSILILEFDDKTKQYLCKNDDIELEESGM